MKPSQPARRRFDLLVKGLDSAVDELWACDREAAVALAKQRYPGDAVAVVAIEDD